MHEPQSSRAPLLHRFAGLASANLLAGVPGLLATLLIAREFGAVGLARISLALSVLSYGHVVAVGGTRLWAVREVASGRQPPEQVASTVAAVRLPLAVLAYLGMIALAQGVPALRDVRGLIAIVGLAVFVDVLNGAWIAQCVHRPGVLAAGNLAVPTLYLLLVAVALPVAPGLAVVAAARLAAEAAAGLGLFAWGKRRLGRWRPLAPRSELLRTVREAAPIAGTRLLVTASHVSDLLIVGLLVEREALGYYAGAVRLVAVLLTAVGAYFVVLFPQVAEQGDPERMAREMRRSLRRALPAGLIVAVAIAFLAEPLLAVLFAPPFVAAAPALRIFGVSVVLHVAGLHYRQLLLARGLQLTDFRWTAIATLVHVGGRLLLVPLLGITGAAVASLAGELALLLTLRWAARIPAEGSTRPPPVGTSQ